MHSTEPGPGIFPSRDDDVVARLRAAGCVFAEDEAAILVEAADGDAGRLEDLVTGRVGGLPLEHLVGWVDFAGRRWAVEAGVFVPRQRTELLVTEAVRLTVDAATETVRDDGPGTATDAAPAVVPGTAHGVSRVVIVDLCCGCGAVGGAVAERLAALGRGVELYAADIDPVAVAVAQRNLADLGGRVTATAATGDLDAPLPPGLRGRVDLLVCNAPYVPTAAIALLPPEAREHEPLGTLDGGADGLDVLRRVMDLAPGWLRPGGHLLFETGETQVSSAVGHAGRAGLSPRVVADEDAGALGVVATRPDQG